MENNNIQMEEFEAMRAQLNILKGKLEKQEIVNDKMMRQAMATKMNYVERYIWFEIFFVLPFCALVLVSFIFSFGASWWWYAFTMVYLAANVYADYYINIQHKPNFNNDLVQAARVLAWQKQTRLKTLLVSSIILVLWMVWVGFIIWGYDTGDQNFDEGMRYGGIGAMIFGASVGGIIGTAIFIKMQRINTELIKQIEEITQKEER